MVRSPVWARLADPTEFDPYAGVRDLTPEEPAVIKPFPSTTQPVPDAASDPGARVSAVDMGVPGGLVAPVPFAWPPVTVPGHRPPAPAGMTAAVPAEAAPATAGDAGTAEDALVLPPRPPSDADINSDRSPAAPIPDGSRSPAAASSVSEALPDPASAHAMEIVE